MMRSVSDHDHSPSWASGALERNIPGRQSPYYSGAGDGGMTDWYDVLKFGFEDTAARVISRLTTLLLKRSERFEVYL